MTEAARACTHKEGSPRPVSFIAEASPTSASRLEALESPPPPASTGSLHVSQRSEPFLGWIDSVFPSQLGLHVQGRRVYEAAREGKSIFVSLILPVGKLRC